MKGLRAEKIFERVVTGVLGRGQNEGKWGRGRRRATARGMAEARGRTTMMEREDDGYVAWCPELDLASQGAAREEARADLAEALALFLETASAAEIARRFGEAAE